MFIDLIKMFRKLHRDQRGITGLETAIILIAFVTVASVLAYSVLSAGIYSAERGTETVYNGLAQAQSTMELKGTVIGTSTDNVSLATIVFQIASVMPGEKIDLSTGANATTTIRLTTDNQTTDDTTWTKSVLTIERGNINLLEDDELMEVIVTVPSAAGIVAYDRFILEIVPQSGAPLTVMRTSPPAIYQVNPMN
jgi:flagellin FlaB